jgi:PKD repeat protein
MGGCADETIATEKVVVGNVSSTARLNADPSTGGAPLTVNFSGSIGINDATPIIDFGDGQTGTVTKGSCIGIAAIIGGTGGIRCSLSANHTYTANGTYTAKLVNASNTSIASATVSVGDTASSGTLVADPQNGNAPLPVAFTYQPGQENGTYWIEFGDGEGQIMHLRPIYCIRAPCISPVGAEHTYKNAGTYEVYVSTYIACMHTNPRCMIATIPLAKTTVTVTGGTSSAGAPVISSFSGPVTLAVNEIGTWSITASDPENGTLKYSILWGDEWTASDAAQRAMAPQASIQQNTTFTHSYSNAGNYTVALTVTDSDGKQARSTATVQVSQTACTKEYKPVCGRPNGCANTCAPGMYCTMQCQLYEPQTYSNRCVMNNSNATFMHEGACTGNEGYLQ